MTWLYFWYSTSCPFFEKDPDEIGSHLREKESKGRSFCTLEAQKPHWRRKRKGGNEKKAMVTLIVFTITTLEIVFGRKIIFDKRGPFGSNIFKNPATHRIWENIKRAENFDHDALDRETLTKDYREAWIPKSKYVLEWFPNIISYTFLAIFFLFFLLVFFGT